jgi:hypothetical protein
MHNIRSVWKGMGMLEDEADIDMDQVDSSILRSIKRPKMKSIVLSRAVYVRIWKYGALVTL